METPWLFGYGHGEDDDFGVLEGTDCFERSSANLLGSQTAAHAEWANEREREKRHLQKIEEERERERAIIAQKKRDMELVALKKLEDEAKARAEMVANALLTAETTDATEDRERARLASMNLVRANHAALSNNRRCSVKGAVGATSRRNSTIRRENVRKTDGCLEEFNEEGDLKESSDSPGPLVRKAPVKIPKATLRRAKSIDSERVSRQSARISRRSSIDNAAPLDEEIGSVASSETKEKVRSTPSRKKSSRGQVSRATLSRRSKSGSEKKDREQRSSMGESASSDGLGRSTSSNSSKQKKSSSARENGEAIQDLVPLDFSELDAEEAEQWKRTTRDVKKTKSMVDSRRSSGESMKGNPQRSKSTSAMPPSTDRIDDVANATVSNMIAETEEEIGLEEKRASTRLSRQGARVSRRSSIDNAAPSAKETPSVSPIKTSSSVTKDKARAAPSRKKSSRSQVSRATSSRRKKSGDEKKVHVQRSSKSENDSSDGPRRRSSSSSSSNNNKSSSTRETGVLQDLVPVDIPELGAEEAVQWKRNTRNVKNAKSMVNSRQPSDDSIKEKPPRSKSSDMLPARIDEATNETESIMIDDMEVEIGLEDIELYAARLPPLFQEKVENTLNGHTSSFEESAFDFNYVESRPIGQKLGSMFGKIIGSTPRGRV